MNRKFGIGILILCFSFSTIHLVRATEVFQVSPIIVQPFNDLREINQQMLGQDRVNRDQELAMIHYRQEVSKCQDVIALTEDVEAMKGVGRLTGLKEGPSHPAGRAVLPSIIVNAPNNQRQAASDEKAEIMALRNKMHQQDLDLKAKEESIRWLNQVVAAAKNKVEYYRLTSQQDRLTMEQVQEEEQQIKGRLGAQLSQAQQQVDLLKSELENQITALKRAIQSGQEAQVQANALRRQLADQQNRVDLLKKELDSKIAQPDQMTLMMSDYQKKLESKNNAYNEQLREILSFKNDWARMQGQVADLSARLQEKEAQVVKIKKDMYDLQKLTSAKDMDAQAQELSLSIELALARKKSNSAPGSDEINFLREGLKKAALQLKQKDEMLSQIKANADEYEKEFKAQAQGFQSLKDQLLNAQMEIIRLKDRSPLTSPSKNDSLREKLKQALDEIDEQGRVINVLVQKLQDAGQSVNLTQYFAKS